MTKVLAGPIGWGFSVLVVDWYTKTIIGHAAGLQAKTAHWLTARATAGPRQFPDGSRDHGLHLMSDNGCQPPSVAFMEAAATLGITQTFTSYNNPKGNAETARLMRTLKEACLWLREWTRPGERERALAAWIEWHNTRYLHSARVSDAVPG
jgi:transposase InsO family protein